MPFAAHAQQPPSDPVVATYRDLLSEANDRIARLNAQAVSSDAKAKALQAELDKLKGEKKAP